jgi:hypothetical protein
MAPGGRVGPLGGRAVGSVRWMGGVGGVWWRLVGTFVLAWAVDPNGLSVGLVPPSVLLYTSNLVAERGLSGCREAVFKVGRRG